MAMTTDQLAGCRALIMALKEFHTVIGAAEQSMAHYVANIADQRDVEDAYESVLFLESIMRKSTRNKNKRGRPSLKIVPPDQ